MSSAQHPASRPEPKSRSPGLRDGICTSVPLLPACYPRPRGWLPPGTGVDSESRVEERESAAAKTSLPSKHSPDTTGARAELTALVHKGSSATVRKDAGCLIRPRGCPRTGRSWCPRGSRHSAGPARAAFRRGGSTCLWVPAVITCGCRPVRIQHCCGQGAALESHQSSVTLGPGLERRRPR